MTQKRGKRTGVARQKPPIHSDPKSTVSRREFEAHRMEVSMEWLAPMPHPGALREYDEIVPGSAAMLFENFKSQSEHRQELERAVVLGSERRADIGQWLAATLFLSTIVGGVIVALATDPRWGAGLVVAGLGSGTWVYMVSGRGPRHSAESDEPDK